MKETKAWRITARKDGERVSYSVNTSTGSMNRLRVHASQFQDKDMAELAAQTLRVDNPGYVFKVVPF